MTTTRGMLLGKFMPPHLGHVYLGEFAERYCDELAIVVGTLAKEPIPGELRYTWMRELFPNSRVLHLTDENPQDPSEHPDFWKIWHDSLTRVLPWKPDYVFASESYGAKLAEILEAQFIPVDPARAVMKISGTKIREDPWKYWDYLPPPVRAHYVRRICVYGPESTGKSTLTQNLADAFHTIAVPEYARTLLEAQNGRIDPGDIEKIARGQIAAEESLARRANRLLIADTDLLTTRVWSEALFGTCPDWIREAADRRSYELYLLTGVDVPFVDDVVRYLPEQRRAFFERMKHELDVRKRPYVIVEGFWEQRWATAKAALEELSARAQKQNQSAP